MIGFFTLLKKEILRFYKVFFQTVAAPVTTSLLYLLVFSQILQDRLAFDSIHYTSFIIPGLIAMSMMQNSFSNTSSSLIQSRVTGSIIFMLLSPMSHIEIFFAYVLAAVARGLTVGFFVWLFSISINPLGAVNYLWVMVFALLTCSIMSVIGMIAGICSEKYDQLAMFQNFLIVPSTFLSGVFYSVQTLPEFWQRISYCNPMFYMIDGFRYGFFEKSDVSPYISLAIVISVLISLSLFALRLMSTGYKLRS
ncbi:ABC transporter permease [Candidatus Kinetoplastidibacterium blastocrithidiae]|nr:ABC transporter permease [Candidatus Kinetoplastibacterium blastocrithidii]